MAPRRLSDSEKQDLVGRYKAGESTSALAEAYGCSPNTVSRTVKSLLPADAYAALKASRLKGSGASPQADSGVQAEPEPPAVASTVQDPVDDSSKDDDSSLALDDADDFGDDTDEELNDDDDIGLVETFTELVPLVGVGDCVCELLCEPLVVWEDCTFHRPFACL